MVGVLWHSLKEAEQTNVATQSFFSFFAYLRGTMGIDDLPELADQDYSDDALTSYVGMALDDQDNVGAVRPRLLRDFVGQRRTCDNFAVFIRSALQRDRALDHTLIHGPPGLGKTTLAQIAANEMGVEIRVTSGPALVRTGDIASILSGLQPKTILFIDEVHRLPKGVEETLYAAMEDFKIDIVIGEGPGARTVRLDLQPFTLIGATTRAGMLSTPFHDRFGIVLDLDFYTMDDIVDILRRQAAARNILITPDGAQAIALRSRGTPRVAGHLLQRIRDFATVGQHAVVDQTIALAALRSLDIDDQGLTRLDRAYLRHLAQHFQGGPVGVTTLSAALNVARDTLELVVEPYLLRLGLLVRSPRGRMLSTSGRTLMNLPPLPSTSTPPSPLPLKL